MSIRHGSCLRKSTYIVLKCIDMMATRASAAGLAERLERLGGERGPCCVPEYRRLARTVLTGGRFPLALRRARAFADQHRLLALGLLRRRKELCACELQAAMGLSHPTVSHHMRLLAGAGLVSSRRQGKWLYYRLRDVRGVELP